MRPLEDCNRYQPEIKRTTKSNSFVASGRLIYIVKKEHDGKTSKFYYAYDVDTKIQLGGHCDKNHLINFISKQDLTCLGETENSLF